MNDIPLRRVQSEDRAAGVVGNVEFALIVNAESYPGLALSTVDGFDFVAWTDHEDLTAAEVGEEILSGKVGN